MCQYAMQRRSAIPAGRRTSTSDKTRIAEAGDYLRWAIWCVPPGQVFPDTPSDDRTMLMLAGDFEGPASDIQVVPAPRWEPVDPFRGRCATITCAFWSVVTVASIAFRPRTPQ